MTEGALLFSFLSTPTLGHSRVRPENLAWRRETLPAAILGVQRIKRSGTDTLREMREIPSPPLLISVLERRQKFYKGKSKYHENKVPLGCV